jgi:hypothetical protein
MSSHDFVARARGEYNEMPGLRLTIWQASKLWHLDHATCTDVLDALVKEGFLFRTADGAYMMWAGPSPAKAALSSVWPMRRAQ